MKYETPQLTVLTPAVNAIQSAKLTKPDQDNPGFHNDIVAAYQDWE